MVGFLFTINLYTEITQNWKQQEGADLFFFFLFYSINIDSINHHLLEVCNL
jgi:hypothetical protein